MEDRSLLHNMPAVPKTSTPVLVISKIIMLAMPIANIVIGAMYLNSCPKQPNIPIYLVVLGVFSLVLGQLSFLPCIKKPEAGASSSLHSLCTAWNSLMTVFVTCWFITGNVWIYSIYPVNFQADVMSKEYCNKTLYLFAFWSTTVTYIILGGILAIGLCVCVCMCLCGTAGLGDTYREDV